MIWYSVQNNAATQTDMSFCMYLLTVNIISFIFDFVVFVIKMMLQSLYSELKHSSTMMLFDEHRYLKVIICFMLPTNTISNALIFLFGAERSVR